MILPWWAGPRKWVKYTYYHIEAQIKYSSRLEDNKKCFLIEISRKSVSNGHTYLCVCVCLCERESLYECVCKFLGCVMKGLFTSTWIKYTLKYSIYEAAFVYLTTHPPSSCSLHLALPDQSNLGCSQTHCVGANRLNPRSFSTNPRFSWFYWSDKRRYGNSRNDNLALVSWRRNNMKILSALLTLWEVNPQVTSWFVSQRVNSMDFDDSRVVRLNWANCRIDSSVAGDEKHCDFELMSV